MKIFKSFFPLFCVAVIALFALSAGCTRSSVIELTGDKGGVLKVGLTGSDIPRSNQPLHPMFTGKNPVSEQLFLPLISRTAEGKIAPILAEKWEFSEDLGAIVYYLRKGVKWSDGVEVTALDVKFTYDLISENPYIETPYRVFLENISSVEILGKYAVKVNFIKPYANELIDSDIYPLPSHVFTGVTTWDEFLATGFGIDPEATVTNGPFKLSSKSPGKGIVLAYYEDYYRGRPAFDSVYFYFFRNSGDMVRSFERGDIDIAMNIFPSYASILSGYEGLSLQTDQAGKRYYAIGWTNTLEPYTLPRFRYALTAAINRENIIKEFLGGQGRIPTTPLSTEFWAVNSELDPIPYDVNLSNMILDSLGLKEREWVYTSYAQTEVEIRPGRREIQNLPNDSIHARKYDGKILVIKLMAFDNSGKAILQRVAEDLGEVGLVCSVYVTTGIQLSYTQKYVKTQLQFGGYHGYILDYAFVNEGVIHPKEAFGREGSINFASFNSTEVDSLLNEATSLLDRRQTKKAWDRFQKIVYDEQPYTLLFTPYELNVMENSLAGVETGEKIAALSIQDMYFPGGEAIAGVLTLSDSGALASLGSAGDSGIIELEATGEALEEAVTTGEEETPLLDTVAVEETPPETTETEIAEDTVITVTTVTGALIEEPETDTASSVTAPVDTQPAVEVVRTNPTPIRLPVASLPTSVQGMGLTRAFVRVTIGSDGTVTSAEVVGSSGNPIADAEAQSAAMGAKFQPATEDGVPVQSQTVIPINFAE
ncbi:TonB family protein [candidate division WOR-3 bacterium]|nr:TonB family protein [candidate division WOR-3 bacterium]